MQARAKVVVLIKCQMGLRSVLKIQRVQLVGQSPVRTVIPCCDNVGLLQTICLGESDARVWESEARCAQLWNHLRVGVNPLQSSIAMLDCIARHQLLGGGSSRVGALSKLRGMYVIATLITNSAPHMTVRAVVFG